MVGHWATLLMKGWSGLGIKDPGATQFAGDNLLLFPRQAGRGSDRLDKSERALAGV